MAQSTAVAGVIPRVVLSPVPLSAIPAEEVSELQRQLPKTYKKPLKFTSLKIGKPQFGGYKPGEISGFPRSFNCPHVDEQDGWFIYPPKRLPPVGLPVVPGVINFEDLWDSSIAQEHLRSNAQALSTLSLAETPSSHAKTATSPTKVVSAESVPPHSLALDVSRAPSADDELASPALSPFVGRDYQRYLDETRLVAGCVSVSVSLEPVLLQVHHDGTLSVRPLTGDSAHNARAAATHVPPLFSRALLIPHPRFLVVAAAKATDFILPKGGWETFESATEAAARETAEEAGVSGSLLPPDWYALAEGASSAGSRRWWCGCTGHTRDSTGAAPPACAPEWRWLWVASETGVCANGAACVARLPPPPPLATADASTRTPRAQSPPRPRPRAEAQHATVRPLGSVQYLPGRVLNECHMYLQLARCAHTHYAESDRARRWLTLEECAGAVQRVHVLTLLHQAARGLEGWLVGEGVGFALRVLQQAGLRATGVLDGPGDECAVRRSLETHSVGDASVQRARASTDAGKRKRVDSSECADQSRVEDTRSQSTVEPSQSLSGVAAPTNHSPIHVYEWFAQPATSELETRLKAALMTYARKLTTQRMDALSECQAALATGKFGERDCLETLLFARDMDQVTAMSGGITVPPETLPFGVTPLIRSGL